MLVGVEVAVMVLAMIGIGGIAFHSSSSDVGLYRLMFNAAWGRCDTRFSFKSKVRGRTLCLDNFRLYHLFWDNW